VDSSVPWRYPAVQAGRRQEEDLSEEEGRWQVRPVVGAEWAAVIEEEALKHLAGHAQVQAAPLDLAALADLCASIKPLPRYEMHVAPDVTDVLAAAFPPASERAPVYVGDISRLTAAPIIPDEDLGPGCWELHADGELIDSGTIGGAS
jgi:hypothetical protein